MTGWDVSRHPEWDLMYKAGLTTREISEICHKSVATIAAHFQKREEYEPGFKALHDLSLENRDPKRPSTRWRQSLKRACLFLEENNRLPRIGGSADEKNLYNWISRQRYDDDRGELSAAKIFLLKNLPGWEVAPKDLEYSRNWRTRLQQLRIFIDAEGRMPRYHNHLSEPERQLGVWLHIQHQRRQENSLTYQRLMDLNTTAPGWNSHW